jgi:riboflavin kinase/FMN adenylyltransferase
VKINQRLDDINLKEGVTSCITLGKFDGIHRGHQKLFRVMKELSGQGQLLVAFTFDFSMRSVLTGAPVQNLFSTEEKRQLLREQGLDMLVECPFTDDIRTMDPEAFVREILIKRLHASSIIIGDDFHFGYQRKGDGALLKRLAERYGYSFYKIEKERDESGLEISSTRVREYLAKGQMEEVQELLGFPYFVDGQVLHGAHLGEKIGSPTINQACPEEKLLPPFGVYYSTVRIGEQEYPAVTNVGYKPTVSSAHQVGVETHVLGFSGDIYEQQVRTSLYHYARPERTFESVEALAACIGQDMEHAADYWNQEHKIG